MKKIEKEPLIKGVFTSEEAKEILSNLFESKIYFHQISALGIEERTGINSPFHKKRISELSGSLKNIIKVIRLASKNNLSLKISCDVKIEIKEALKKPNV